MTDETNGADMAAAEAAAVALNQPEGEKTYLEPKGETPEAQDDTPGEDATAAQPEPDAEAEHQPKPKKTAKDRIDELTWQKRELERQNQALLDRLGGQQPPAQEAHPQPTDGRPDPSFYEGGVYDPQFLEDITDWKAEQAVTRRLAQHERVQTVKTRLDSFQAKAGELFPDGDPEGLIAFREYPGIPPGITEVILVSDVGPKIAEHLGDHPSEFQRISGLSPALQARELTLLESRLSGASKQAAKPSPRTVTAAPEPPPTARGAGGRFQVAADTADFSAFEKQYLKSGG